ncbi:MAG: hypothetical protein KKB70_07930 [Proteobacteria bacterium]|nr:hypothetical protein [Pseudomonadota bacterium]
MEVQIFTLEQFLTFISMTSTSILVAAAFLLAVLVYIPFIQPLLRTRKGTSLYDRFPIEHIIVDKGHLNGTCLTKDGRYVCVLEVEGRNYQGLDESILLALQSKRQAWIENIPSEVTVLVHSHRVHCSREIFSCSVDGCNLAQRVINLWNSFFSTTFRSLHYIIFIADAGSALDRVENAAAKIKAVFSKKQEISDFRLLQCLTEAVQQTHDRLGDEYAVHQLKGDALFSYFGTLLQGEQSNVKASSTGYVEGILSGTDLFWPDGKRYQEYRGTKTRFSAWLSIKTPAMFTISETFNSLFRMELEFSIYQSASVMDRAIADAKIKDFETNASKGRSLDSLSAELDGLKTRLEQGDTSLFQQRLAIEVFADDLETLENRVQAIKRRMELDSYIIHREDLNQEAMFWGKFPGAQKINPRHQFPTSENMAQMVTLPARIKGAKRCSFGDAPIAPFQTLEGDVYNLILHENEDRHVLGNTLVIGSSGLGKTTLVQFLMMNCMKYPGFRALAFDRGNGMEVMTKMLRGTHFGADKIGDIGLNPLHLADSESNRTFLMNWMTLLSGTDPNDAKLQKKLNEAIQMTFELPMIDRHLSQFYNGIGREGDDLAYAFEPWIKGGQYGEYFTAYEDTLNFRDHKLATFEMGTLLDTKKVLAPLLSYMWHKIRIESAGDPYVMFVDEAPKFFENEVFAPRGKQILDEIRKSNGIGIFAGQNASDFLGKWYSESFQKQIATTIFFPDPQANWSDYKEFGVNPREFEFIKHFQPTKGNRAVLVKRNFGESVFLRVDLSWLGKHVTMFESSAFARTNLNRLMEEYPEDFENRYLDFMAKEYKGEEANRAA